MSMLTCGATRTLAQVLVFCLLWILTTKTLVKEPKTLIYTNSSTFKSARDRKQRNIRDRV